MHDALADASKWLRVLARPPTRQKRPALVVCGVNTESATSESRARLAAWCIKNECELVTMAGVSTREGTLSLASDEQAARDGLGTVVRLAFSEMDAEWDGTASFPRRQVVLGSQRRKKELHEEEYEKLELNEHDVEDFDVVVMGSGVKELMLAAMLVCKGVPTTVVDRAVEVGSRNTVYALGKLGVERTLVGQSPPTATQRFVMRPRTVPVNLSTLSVDPLGSLVVAEGTFYRLLQQLGLVDAIETKVKEVDPFSSRVVMEIVGSWFATRVEENGGTPLVKIPYSIHDVEYKFLPKGFLHLRGYIEEIDSEALLGSTHTTGTVWQHLKERKLENDKSLISALRTLGLRESDAFLQEVPARFGEDVRLTLRGSLDGFHVANDGTGRERRSAFVFPVKGHHVVATHLGSIVHNARYDTFFTLLKDPDSDDVLYGAPGTPSAGRVAGVQIEQRDWETGKPRSTYVAASKFVVACASRFRVDPTNVVVKVHRRAVGVCVLRGPPQGDLLARHFVKGQRGRDAGVFVVAVPSGAKGEQTRVIHATVLSQTHRVLGTKSVPLEVSFVCRLSTVLPDNEMGLVDAFAPMINVLGGASNVAFEAYEAFDVFAPSPRKAHQSLSDDGVLLLRDMDAGLSWEDDMREVLSAFKRITGSDWDWNETFA